MSGDGGQGLGVGGWGLGVGDGCGAPQCPLTNPPTPKPQPPNPQMTFSIVAHDHATGDLGIAVASKFLGVGAVVPWAQAGVGAIATQSFANTLYGARGLDLLKGGYDPRQTIEHLLADDVDAEVPMRQLGIV